MTNFKKDNDTGKNHEGTNSNMPLQFLTASSIIGDKVVNTKGENMGAIHDIMIKLSTGSIEYFVIEIGGFLGIGEKFFAFPYRLLSVDPVSENFVLDQELVTLKNAPGFNKDHWPETNGHQFSQSGTYWGDFIGSNGGAVPY